MASKKVYPNSNIPFGSNLQANAYKGAQTIAAFTLAGSVNGAPMASLIQGYETFVKVYADQIRNSRRSFLAAHNRAANKARGAMLRAYDDRVIGEEKARPYRTNPQDARLQRYAGGKLRNVLESPGFFKVSYNSIGIGDIQRLDTEAPQWSRLNFGAGGKGSSGPHIGGGGGTSSGYKSNFTTYFQRAATDLLDKPGARPGFKIPRGFWFSSRNNPVAPGENKGDKFYPYSRVLAHMVATGSTFNPDHPDTNTREVGNVRGARFSRKRLAIIQSAKETRGIKARRFIDSGIFELFSALGGEYSLIVDRWQREATAAKPRGPLAPAVGNAVGEALAFKFL